MNAFVGPHRGVQPTDVRECAHVVSFGRYTHETYPLERIVGCENIVAHEYQMREYVKHLEESMREL